MYGDNIFKNPAKGLEHRRVNVSSLCGQMSWDEARCGCFPVWTVLICLCPRGAAIFIGPLVCVTKVLCYPHWLAWHSILKCVVKIVANCLSTVQYSAVAEPIEPHSRYPGAVKSHSVEALRKLLFVLMDGEARYGVIDIVLVTFCR